MPDTVVAQAGCTTPELIFGLVVGLFRHGLIPSVTEAFATLASKGRYRVADSAALVLLRSVGEA